MDRARIDSRYTNIIKIYIKMPHFMLRLTKNYKPIKLKYNEGDPISPKLFILALEDVFKELAWEKRG